MFPAGGCDHGKVVRDGLGNSRFGHLLYASCMIMIIILIEIISSINSLTLIVKAESLPHLGRKKSE
jgi:hypothetical protein